MRGDEGRGRGGLKGGNINLTTSLIGRLSWKRVGVQVGGEGEFGEEGSKSLLNPLHKPRSMGVTLTISKKKYSLQQIIKK